MSVALDTSALLARHLAGPWQVAVSEALAADRDWCASALAVSEALSVVDRLTDDPAERRALRRALRADGERLALVPVDTGCLARAAELARDHPLRTVDALHLAAADRLPRPVTFVTFDPHQMPVAEALGFHVVST